MGENVGDKSLYDRNPIIQVSKKSPEDQQSNFHHIT